MEESLYLKQKSDGELILNLKGLIAKEREVLAGIIQYLEEIEARRLYLTKGYSSLFAFMTGELGYSESSAMRRIQAMRLVREVPEVEKKIEKGTISLSVAAQVQGYIQQENKKRRLENQEILSISEKFDLVKQSEGTSARECEAKLSRIAPEVCLPKEKTRPLTPEKTLIQFLVGPDLMKKIQRLKNLTSHQNPEGSYEKIFEKAVDLALEKLDPEKREQRRREKSLSSPLYLPAKGGSASGGKGRGEDKNQPPTSAVDLYKRHISKTLRDRVWLRDEGKCQYRDAQTGRICGSSYLVEVDHRYPFALGGENRKGNLRLRCRKHNQFQAMEIFGSREIASLRSQ